MNFNKILFVAGLAVTSCFSAYAQEEVETEYVFNPHWYVQGQFGFQHTLGEIDWSDLNSPNAQVAVGYNWSSVWGARFAFNFWQSKGGIQYRSYAPGNQDFSYKWNYVAPTVDVTMNVTNLFWGYNPKRLVDFSVFAGIGANIGFNNDDAETLNERFSTDMPEQQNYFGYLWTGSKCNFLTQFGVNLDFRINDRVSLGIEQSFNTLSDHYNSQKAGNADWYFNTLASVKVNIGKTYTKRAKKLTPCEPTYVDREVIKEVEKIVYRDKEVTKEGPIRRDLYFVIRGSEISSSEKAKLEEVVSYLNRNPQAKVTVTGYADKGTGNARINMKYSQTRVDKVVRMLKENYNISADRIFSAAKGDTEQPFAENDKNRVTIVVAE